MFGLFLFTFLLLSCFYMIAFSLRCWHNPNQMRWSLLRCENTTNAELPHCTASSVSSERMRAQFRFGCCWPFHTRIQSWCYSVWMMAFCMQRYALHFAGFFGVTSAFECAGGPMNVVNKNFLAHSQFLFVGRVACATGALAQVHSNKHWRECHEKPSKYLNGGANGKVDPEGLFRASCMANDVWCRRKLLAAECAETQEWVEFRTAPSQRGCEAMGGRICQGRTKKHKKKKTDPLRCKYFSARWRCTIIQWVARANLLGNIALRLFDYGHCKLHFSYGNDDGYSVRGACDCDAYHWPVCMYHHLEDFSATCWTTETRLMVNAGWLRLAGRPPQLF